MTLDEALKILDSTHPQAARIRELCDPSHPDYDPDCAPLVLRVAAEPPTLLGKAANLAGAVVRHVAGGMKTVGQAEADRRLAICRACPLLDGDSCRLCGCDMPTKVTWAEQKCPEGKW